MKCVLGALILILGIKGLTYSQAQERYRDKYDLDFMNLGQIHNTWSHGTFRSSNAFGYSSKDSVKHVYGRFPVGRPIDFHIKKSVKLPCTPKKTLELSAKLLFPTADSISMLTYRLEKDSKDWRIDTATWRRPSGLEEEVAQPLTIRSEFTDSSTTKIQIHIVAYLPKVEPYDSPSRGRMHATGTLYGVDVLVDGKSIREQQVKPVGAVTLKKNYPIQILGTRDSLDFSQLKVLNKRRIISLGETMHFNPTMQGTMRSLGLYLVKNRGASLILSEGSLAISLMKDRYINDESYVLAPEYMDPLECNTLKSLKEESLHQRRKVHYLSFDVATSSEVLGPDICSFLFSLPNWPSNLAVCRLVDRLLSTKTLDGALEVVRLYRKELREVLREEEVSIIEHMLRQNERLPREGFERLRLRDKYMAENIRFLVDLLSPDKHKPVLLYAHLDHLGVAPVARSIATKPCGAYLKEWYKDDYYGIAMLTEGGETKVDKGFVGWGSEAVAAMPEGTFESVLAARSDFPYFMEIPKAWDKLCRGRLTGTSPSNSPLPYEYNLYEQVQGLFFLPGRALSEMEKQAIRDVSQDIAFHMRMMQRQKEYLEVARKKIEITQDKE